MLWVLDLDGVVWLAGTAIPGAAEAVRRLHGAGEAVAFVTNNSGPTLADYVARLDRVGIEIDASELVTSAQAAASLLEPGSRAGVVGEPGVTEALEARGVAVVPVADHPAAVVVGRSLSLDFDSLAAASNAVRAGARFIATNTDPTYPTSQGLEPGAGAVVAYVEVASGTKAEVAGKPHEAVAKLLRERFGAVGLVIGDRPDTDGAFAQLLDAPFALVLTGVTKPSDLPVSPVPAITAADLAAVVAARLVR